MNNELTKTYSPTEFESEMYSWWEKNGYFKPEKQKELGILNDDTETFCMTIPPPNVTGILHLGHAIIISVQDLMTRFARMQGKETVFVPGSDHAGIATQNVVERELNKIGIKRKEIGRAKFVDEVWKWKEKSHSIIVKQSKMMGLSTDWDRERFTMDDQLSRAVREAFVTLFEQDLIYRGSYLINWCSGKCESAISSLEAIPEEVQGKLWYIKYPVVSAEWNGPTAEWGTGNWAEGATQFIEVATTRPETLLGDSAIATSKTHKKYGKLIGKEVVLPVLARKIMIIEDENVDAEFGTGALKITPAHDFNDYEVGKRHNLELYTMLDEKSRIVEEFGGPYAGMDRFECRDAILVDLEKEGLLGKIEDHPHAIPHCERCHTIVEPRNSVQWFVRTKPMAEIVLKLMETEKVTFVPERYDERFRIWMENIQDWCISRQLWWGHRIPVWFCDECDEMTCAREDPTKCSSCGSEKIKQEEDVLDTWFSSGLWPFSTLGWPEKTEDLKKFYPNTIRETGYDILLIWVAREMMLGATLTDTLPYHTIYLHGMIRDETGRKVSKSMENIDEYDPLLIIKKFGADTLRYTLLSYSTPGLDMNVDPKNIESSHRFGNKIWQATRYLLGNLKDDYKFLQIAEIDLSDLEIADRWILSKLHVLTREVTKHYDDFEYLEAGRAIRKFFWSSFADWYIEISKIRIYEDTEKFSPIHILLHVLDITFRLLHPFMPFITEKLWQALPEEFRDQQSIMVSQWPEVIDEFIDTKIEAKFDLIINIIVSIRRIRGEFKVPPSKKIPLMIAAGDHSKTLNAVKGEISRLGLVDPDNLRIEKSIDVPKKIVSESIGDIKIYIPIEGLIEIDEEIKRLEKEMAKLGKLIQSSEAKLNGEFANRAPKELVNKEKENLTLMMEQIQRIQEQKAILSS